MYFSSRILVYFFIVYVGSKYCSYCDLMYISSNFDKRFFYESAEGCWNSETT